MNSSARDGLLAGLLLAQALGQVSPVGLGTALRQRLDQGLHGAPAAGGCSHGGSVPRSPRALGARRHLRGNATLTGSGDGGILFSVGFPYAIGSPPPFLPPQQCPPVSRTRWDSPSRTEHGDGEVRLENEAADVCVCSCRSQGLRMLWVFKAPWSFRVPARPQHRGREPRADTVLFLSLSSCPGGEAAGERPQRERGGVHKQRQRGHARGKDLGS